MTSASPTRRATALRYVLSRVLDVLAKRRVLGAENIPRAGGCLLVFNQTSLVDTPLLSILVPRADVTGLVAKDYRRNPVYRFLVECGGGLWIRRGEGDRSALAAAVGALEKGWVVGISPEGRRTRTGGLATGKPGPAFLARRAGVPIVPVGFSGTGRLAAEWRRLRRPTITITVGEPFRLPAAEGRGRKQRLRSDTEFIMCRIASLLPPSARGVYAGHPFMPPPPPGSDSLERKGT